MATTEEISQRDLRNRSREIMDAVEGGQRFIVTRGGREIGQLVPVAARRRFVPRSAFARASEHAPVVDAERFRADIDAAFDDELDDPYAR